MGGDAMMTSGLRVTLTGLAARHPAARADGPLALKPLSLSIEPGTQVAVIGPSGAGKTTLLHAIACALKPATGSMQLDGADPWRLSVSELQKLRGRLFLAPQVPPLPPRQRVITSVLAARLPAQSFWRSLRSLLYPDDIGAAYQTLMHFDLADKLWERVDRLSGGERQRVALARALLSPASLWLIDEPLSALDPTRAHHAIDTLTRLAKQRGITLIVSLHQVDVATQFARVIGLRDGDVALDLPGATITHEQLTQLYAQHEHELAGAAPPQPEPIAPPVVTVTCR